MQQTKNRLFERVGGNIEKLQAQHACHSCVCARVRVRRSAVQSPVSTADAVSYVSDVPQIRCPLKTSAILVHPSSPATLQACQQSTWYLANRLPGLVMALNSSALPLGSCNVISHQPLQACAICTTQLPCTLKNMVNCSPGWPAAQLRQASIHRLRQQARSRTLEAQVGLDDKLDASLLQLSRERLELRHRERQSKMRHRHCVPIHSVVAGCCVVASHSVQHDLVSKQAVILRTWPCQYVDMPAAAVYKRQLACQLSALRPSVQPRTLCSTWVTSAPSGSAMPAGGHAPAVELPAARLHAPVRSAVLECCRDQRVRQSLTRSATGKAKWNGGMAPCSSAAAAALSATCADARAATSLAARVCGWVCPPGQSTGRLGHAGGTTRRCC